MIDNILINKETIEKLQSIMVDNPDDLDSLFSMLTDNFPEYPEMSTEKCPSIYVSAPSSTAVTCSKGLIPANWIEVTGVENRKIIAGQPPVVDVLDRFWLAIWENNVNTILDLRHSDEYLYQDLNIYPYWPTERGESVILDSCSIAHEGITRVEYHGIIMNKHEYILLHKDSQMKKIFYRYEYPRWRDLTAIKGESLFLFCQWIEEFFASHEQGSVMYIHCRGGVGRTGVIVGSYLMYYQIRNNIFNKSNIVKGLLRTIAQCRWSRGRLFICNSSQLSAVLLLTKFLMAGQDD